MREKLNVFRRRLFLSRLPHLTRKGKLLRNLICVVLLGALCAVLLGVWQATPEQALRQAERSYLLGPSNIIGVIYPDDYPMMDRLEDKAGPASTMALVWDEVHQYMVVSELGDQIFCYLRMNKTDGWLHAMKKQGEVSLNEIMVGRDCTWLLLYTTLPGVKYARLEGREYSWNIENVGDKTYTYTARQTLFEIEAETAGNGLFFLLDDAVRTTDLDLPVRTVTAESPTDLEYPEEDLPQSVFYLTLLNENGEILYEKPWIKESGDYYED